MAKAPLIILAGPSGSGKSTISARLLKDSSLPLRLSVSATTRSKRPYEQNGDHYWFWTREQFQEQLRAGAFLERAEVNGESYGTLRSEVDEYRARGIGVLLDIDVQGAAQVRSRYPDCVSIFIRTSSWEEYEQRLRKRGTETKEQIARRLATAKCELERIHEFDHVVVNDDLETAVAQVRDWIVQAFPKGSSNAG
ncbi:MAG TPA: guanylate kinase [Gemmataceae bacterium]|jgi:guanylate kinase